MGDYGPSTRRNSVCSDCCGSTVSESAALACPRIVDEEFQMALLRVVSRGGSPSPPPRHPGRTRWSFLKDVPRDLLPGGLKAASERGHRGLPKAADASTRPSGGGEGGGQDKQRATHQRQQQQQQSRDDASRRDRVSVESGRRAQQGGDHVKGIGADAAGRAEPTPPATALSGVGDTQPDVATAAAAAAAAIYPKTPRVKADGDRDDDFYSGTDSDDPSTVLSPTTAARMRCPVEVKASRTGRSATANTGGAGRAGAAAAAAGQAGLGVFCKAGLKVGDVVFEEEALLRVSKEAVGRRPWEAVAAEGRWSKSWGVSAMDLLQVVAFEGAPPSVQERVLQLFAPDPEGVPQGRLHALEFFLDKLWTAMGALRPPAASSSSCVAAAANGKGAGRLQDAGSRGGDGGDGGEIGRKRRSLLMKVLMICDANIFGEGANEENGPRSLFWLGCRINHSCLPNCSYHVLDGRMVVRAIADVEQGEELLVSYLAFDHVARPTPDRRLRLLETKIGGGGRERAGLLAERGLRDDAAGGAAEVTASPSPPYRRYRIMFASSAYTYVQALFNLLAFVTAVRSQ
ncbi:conserved unknown protein [Ectocarpus siliculosus]|uniref:SET domain-containing protein n=1 Tax=Ectocarpus siliculosus TaxID=2880 RepID=D7FXF6_ECTSI|nr:conserved unknown protein [Ectocarpus siliculosus]|eukprot:CBJ32293.1 conserved unknown protein [Ectocarpus siliculosus]